MNEISLLFIIGTVFAALTSLFALWWVIPFLIFYGLPFLVLSGAMSGLWFFLSRKTDSKRRYERLAIFIPVCLLITWSCLNYFQPVVAVEHLLRQTQFTDGYHVAFNQFYRRYRSLLPWFGVPALYSYSYEHVKWICYLALLAGAPSLLLWFARQDAKKLAIKSQREREAEIKHVESLWERKLKEEESKTHKLEQEVVGLRRERSTQDKEIENLRLREKYYTGGVSKSASPARTKDDLEFL